MKIAENFDQFVERVSEAERTVLNSPAGQALTEELLQMKLAQNPNMTAEEWAQTKSEFMTFLFAMFVKETPEAMKELGGHVWNALQEAPYPPRNAKKPAEGNYTPCGLPRVLALSMARPAGFYPFSPFWAAPWPVWLPSTITASTPAAAASAVAASTVPTFSPASS